MPARRLRLKAEVAFGMQLVLRHRAPRFVAFLVALVVLLVRHGGGSPERLSRTLLLAAGTLAVAGASRVFAPGSALAAARRVAEPWWLAPCGRLAGVLLVVLAGTAAAAAVLYAEDVGAALTVLAVCLLFAAAVAALTAALTPLVGASSATALGVVPVWFGSASPESVGRLLAMWPHAVRPVVVLWNVLPLGWRALALLAEPHAASALLLGAWLAVGLCGVAWCVERPPWAGTVT